MMTIEMITAMLDTASADCSYYVCGDGKEISFTIDDFGGFDEDWCELFRDYTDPAAVERVLEWLKKTADRIEDDFYVRYHFGDIVVEVGYTSYDI